MVNKELHCLWFALGLVLEQCWYNLFRFPPGPRLTSTCGTFQCIPYEGGEKQGMTAGSGPMAWAFPEAFQTTTKPCTQQRMACHLPSAPGASSEHTQIGLTSFTTLRNVPMHSVRGRREAGDDSGIWFDGLGIPRGIPDYYKALNPAANGLASTLCPWCVIGAHTDWINFLYYTEMKFQNLTTDGLQKIREELHAKSTLTRQNTTVLEILTAMNGGICVMLGTAQCCTYVPDNTPDGKDLDLILQKMQKMSNKMKGEQGLQGQSKEA